MPPLDREGMHAPGVIRPVTVRSVLDAANADEALLSSKAAVSRDIRWFMCWLFLDDKYLEIALCGQGAIYRSGGVR
jgi:hypothetical protein